MGTKAIDFNEEDFLSCSSNFYFKTNIDSKINKKDKLLFSTENKENKQLNKNFLATEEFSNTTSTFDKTKCEYVPFDFKWKNEDNLNNKEIEVMITGSFLNNWNTCIPMIKNPKTNEYEYKTSLPKEKHYFKYIINNKWRCSDLYPTCSDGSNNINNYIDLTNYNTNDSLKHEESKDNTFLNAYKDDDMYDMYDIYDIYNISNEGYNLKYPLIKDLNTTAPSVFINYKKPFNLDYQSNQNKLNDLFSTDNIYYKNRNYINEYNNSYKKIFNFPHEKICHFIANIDNYYTNTKTLRFSITERKINKCITFIYYKPKK